jgi:hypothetical protein
LLLDTKERYKTTTTTTTTKMFLNKNNSETKDRKL